MNFFRNFLKVILGRDPKDILVPSKRKKTSFSLMERDDIETLFRDTFLNFILVLVVWMVILIPFINPVTTSQTGDLELHDKTLLVEIVWPSHLNVDIDLWVQAPGESATGFANNSSTASLNLLRDDMGLINDTLNLNYEIIQSRGTKQGTYTVNLHYYSNHDRTQVIESVEVSVRISLKTGSSKPAILLQKTVHLYRVGEELTVYNFDLNDKSEFVHSSVNELYVPLVQQFLQRRN